MAEYMMGTREDWERDDMALPENAAAELAAELLVRREQSALDVQVGGDHYKKLAIQPMEYSMANKLDACQHTAIKYITRFRDKGGVGDLEKAKHVIDMLIEFEQRKATLEY